IVRVVAAGITTGERASITAHQRGGIALPWVTANTVTAGIGIRAATVSAGELACWTARAARVVALLVQAAGTASAAGVVSLSRAALVPAKEVRGARVRRGRGRQELANIPLGTDYTLAEIRAIVIAERCSLGHQTVIVGADSAFDAPVSVADSSTTITRAPIAVRAAAAGTNVIRGIKACLRTDDSPCGSRAG
ncbi:MAG: hypothetical protein AB7G88_14265, partial [Thermomicrobiales bacterium]